MSVTIFSVSKLHCICFGKKTFSQTHDRQTGGQKERERERARERKTDMQTDRRTHRQSKTVKVRSLAAPGDAAS